MRALLLLLCSCSFEIRNLRHDGELDVYSVGTARPLILKDSNNRLYLSNNYNSSPYVSADKQAGVIHGIIGGYYLVSPNIAFELSIYFKMMESDLIDKYSQDKIDSDSFWNAEQIIYFGGIFKF